MHPLARHVGRRPCAPLASCQRVPPAPRRAAPSLAAFTLIELLVVVAIIVVLIAILIPSLSRAKEHTRRTICQSNQREILRATALYATEWDDVMPFGNSHKMETNSSLRWYQIPGWLYQTPNQTNPNDVKAGLLWPYLRTTKIYRCPSEFPPYSFPNSTHQLTSYLMNGAVNAYGSSTASPFTAYKRRVFATDAICFWEVDETIATSGFWNDGNNYPSEGLTRRHGDGASVACFGGHVEYITQKEFQKLAGQSFANRLYCNPAKADGHP